MTGPYGTAASNEPYPSGVVAAGVVASIFMPVISLIVALILGTNENNPTRKGQLKSWAILSGALMLVAFVLVFGLLAASRSVGY